MMYKRTYNILGEVAILTNERASTEVIYTPDPTQLPYFLHM